jgi:hypothetical protein
MVKCMTRRQVSNSRTLFILCELVFLVAGSGRIVAEPPAGAVATFNSYIGAVEARLARQHGARDGFLASEATAQLRRGEVIVERMTPVGGGEFPGAMLHDWRGTAFVPGATAADFERLMKDLAGFPRYYAPQVVQAKGLAQGDHIQAVMRVRQKHVITVVEDIAYDVTFARLDAQHGYSISRSTRIAEIDAPGTAKEHALGPSEEHGFLWRLNSYWSYEERDGGLYMQIESVSLTRAIPTGLGWLIGPFVESVPRESLEFTLHSTCNALRK